MLKIEKLRSGNLLTLTAAPGPQNGCADLFLGHMTFCAAGSHGPVSEHSRTLWMEPIGINGRLGCQPLYNLLIFLYSACRSKSLDFSQKIHFI